MFVDSRIIIHINAAASVLESLFCGSAAISSINSGFSIIRIALDDSIYDDWIPPNAL